MRTPTGMPHLLPVVPAVVAALLLALALAATRFIVADDLTQRALRRVEQSSRLLAERVGVELSRRAAELEWLSHSAALQQDAPDPGEVRETLQRLKDSSGGYVWIGWVGRDGVVIAASDRLLEGVGIGERPVFIHGRQALWFGSLHPPVALRAPLQQRGSTVPAEVADLALPVLDRQGRLRGVLAAHLSVERFHDLLSTVLGPATGLRDLTMAVLDRDLAPVIGAPPALTERGSETGTRAQGPGGETWVLARHGVTAEAPRLDVGWQILSAQPLRAALAPAAELERVLAGGGALAALLIGGAGVWFSRRLSRPYSRIIDAMAARVSASPRDPSAALDAVLDQIRLLPARTDVPAPGEALVRRVLHDVERIKTVLDRLPAPVYCLDADYRLVYWNQDAARAFGWATNAMARPVLEVLKWVDPTAQQRQVMQRLHDEAGPWVFELHTQRLDGVAIDGEWHVNKVLDVDGRFGGLIAMVRDRTEERQARQRLGEQTETLSAIIRSSSDAIISTDASGRVELFNPAAERIFQVDAEDIVGRSLDRLLPPGHRHVHGGHLQRFSESNTTLRSMGAGRVGGQRADGQPLELEASISQVTVRGRKVLTAILRDVSERAKAERAQAQYQAELQEARDRLAEQTETLSAIIQSSSDAIISTDASGRVELFNPAAERIFQVTAATMMGQALDRLLPEPHRGRHAEHLRHFAESNTTLRSMGAGRVGGRRADGQPLELEASISQVSVRGRKVLTAILRDVSERARTERQQAQHQMELTELTHRLMDQEKDTTRRLAQILHDRLGQTLSAMRLSVEALPGLLADVPPPPAQARLDVLHTLARSAVDEVRQALSELRPPLLEASGLAVALENECRLRRPEALPAELRLAVEADVRDQRWPADVEHAAFMIAREAVINAARHANARFITVTLGGGPAALLLDVSDDGSGLPAELAFGRPGHLGLVGMRERAIAIGARLLATTAPEGGTLVRMEWERPA